MVEIQMRDLFAADPKRFSQFSLEVGEILFDYSKQRVTKETLHKLCAYAKEVQLSRQIEALFSGKIVNTTEQRPALHTALRDPTTKPILVEGQDIKPQIHRVLNRMEAWVEAVRSGSYPGASNLSNRPIQDIISLGIGGSDLGPSMVCQALQDYKTTAIRFHFISNVDGKTLTRVLKKCDPRTTLCIINSKTFTTPETLLNAKAIKEWFSCTLGLEKTLSHLIGVTANPKQALLFGIPQENIFEFWDFVGGRYSIWSAVGLPIALSLGMARFREFLAGAHAIDNHFIQQPFSENVPVLMGLIGIWNINFWNNGTQAIIPYDDGLRQFPDYLQQLEMESNGKSVSALVGRMSEETENLVSYATAPIIWGGVGCNGQHAYMQLLHQGTQIIPVDFLIHVKGDEHFQEHHHLLLASCLSQSKALMEGERSSSLAKQCLGNRPSSTLMYPKLTPEVLGSLIALYEHKVFVQGVLWGINSFDQWGVELGKKLVKNIFPLLEKATLDTEDLDSSTQGLLNFMRKNRDKKGKLPQGIVQPQFP
jgi:glucose-6-phosphate isomerase